MTSYSVSSIWKRKWRRTSSSATLPISTRMSPRRWLGSRRCSSSARSSSRSVILPARSKSCPSGRLEYRCLLKTIWPFWKWISASSLGCSDVTVRIPVFLASSRSWSTSWMLISCRGPSIAIATSRHSGDVSLHAPEADARRLVIRIESQHPPERRRRLLDPPHLARRLGEASQGIQGIRIGVQQVRQHIDRGLEPPAPPLHRRQRHRRLAVTRQQFQGDAQFLRRLIETIGPLQHPAEHDVRGGRRSVQ